ncbi:YggT family protein [Candidatus Gracilibacteria bacterium]|nr:YggT family protein [Candidatus Gracilibacteria bacterium]
MQILFQTIQIFCEILQWIVFVDVILSWFTLIGLRIYLMPIRWILDPLYARIDRMLPTTFLGVSFTPFLLLMAIYMLQAGTLFCAQFFL